MKTTGDPAVAGSTLPIVSIVIPCFNAREYVRAAIESALNQTLERIEIIVVDDGSDDETKAVLQEYADDPRISLVRQGNAGASAARNRGIANSIGRYVGFLDADDIWHPTKAAVHASYMDKHENVDATFSQWDVIDADGRHMGRRSRVARKQVSYDDLLVENVAGNASTLVVRRSAFGRAGVLNEALESNEDLEWLLRIAETGSGNIHGFGEVLTSYRRHRQQITSDWRRMRRGWTEVLRIAERRQPDRVLARRAEAWAHQGVYWSYLAYESGDYQASRRLLTSAWKSAPRPLAVQLRVWLITAAVAASALPAPLHSYIRRLAEKVSGRRFT